MPTAEHCLAMADEAERLASIVSYTRDKVRLHEQAKCWREKAHTLQLAADPPCARKARTGLGLPWFHRRPA